MPTEPEPQDPKAPQAPESRPAERHPVYEAANRSELQRLLGGPNPATTMQRLSESAPATPDLSKPEVKAGIAEQIQRGRESIRALGRDILHGLTLAPFRGAEAFGQGIYNDIDQIVTFLPDYDTKLTDTLLGPSDSGFERFMEGAVEIGIGLVPVGRGVSWAASGAKAASTAGKGGKFVKGLGFFAKETEEELLELARIQRGIALGAKADQSMDAMRAANRLARNAALKAAGSDLGRQMVSGAVVDFLLVPFDPKASAEDRIKNMSYGLIYGPAWYATARTAKAFVTYSRPPEIEVRNPDGSLRLEFEDELTPIPLDQAPVAPGGPTAAPEVPTSPKTPVATPEAPTGLSVAPTAAIPRALKDRTADWLKKVVNPEDANRILKDAYEERMTNPAAEVVGKGVEEGRFSPRDLTPEERVMAMVKKTGINTRWFPRGERGSPEFDRVLNEFADIVTESRKERSLAAAEADDLLTAASMAKMPQEVFQGLFQGDDAQVLRKVTSRVRVKLGLVESFSEQASKAATEAVQRGDDLGKLIAFEDIAFATRLAADLRGSVYELGYGLRSLRQRTKPADYVMARSQFVQEQLSKDAARAKTRNQVLPNNIFMRVNPAIPAEALTGNVEEIAKRFEQYGGKKEVEKILEVHAAIANSKQPAHVKAAQFSELQERVMRPSLLSFTEDAVFLSYFMNPRSWKDVAWGQFVNSNIIRSSQHLSGGGVGSVLALASGDKTAAVKNAKQLVQGLGEFFFLLSPETWKRSIAAGWETSSKSLTLSPDAAAKAPMLGSRVTKEWADLAMKEAGINPEGLQAYLYRNLASAYHNIFSLPGKVYRGIDGFTKELTRQQTVKSDLMVEALFDKGVPAWKVPQYVDDNMGRRFREGRLITEEVIYEESYNTALRQARARADATGEMIDLTTVKKSAADIAQQQIKDSQVDLGATAYGARRAEEGAMTSQLPKGGFTSKFNEFVNAVPGLRMMAPVIRTEFNNKRFAAQTFDALGLFKAMIANSEKARLIFPDQFEKHIASSRLALVQDAMSQDPRMRAEMLGRFARAVTITAGIGTWAASKDPEGRPFVTGSPPKDPKDRADMENAKIPPYSFLVDGKYHSYERVAPKDDIAFIVDMMNLYGNESAALTEDEEGALSSAVLISMMANMQPSYLKTFTEIGDLIDSQDPDRAETWSFRMGANVIPIPPGLNQIADTLGVGGTPVGREIHSFKDAVFAKIPWLRNQVEVRRNVIGEPMPKKDRTLLRAWDIIEPSDDPLDIELALLKSRIGGMPRTYEGMDMFELRNKKDISAWTRVQEVQSTIRLGEPAMTLRQALDWVIRQDEYRALPMVVAIGATSKRAQILSSIISQYRQAALLALTDEFPELQLRALYNKIQPLVPVEAK